jgi:hypothetical protein
MSSEVFSAENRNNIQIPGRRVQCCSLCRQPGHNITRCNSERILEFETMCAEIVRLIDNTDDFKNWLFHNFINEQLLLKAFVIRKFRITTRLGLDQYINYITQYIFRTYKNIPQTEEEYQAQLVAQSQTQALQNNIFVNDLAIFLTVFRNRTQEPEIINPLYGLTEYLAYLSNLGRSIMRAEELIPLHQRERIISRVENTPGENVDEICQCSICWDDKELKQFIKLDCNHEFCKDCIKQTLRLETRTNLTCALCRSETRTFILRTQEVQDELIEMSES